MESKVALGTEKGGSKITQSQGKTVDKLPPSCVCTSQPWFCKPHQQEGGNHLSLQDPFHSTWPHGFRILMSLVL